MGGFFYTNIKEINLFMIYITTYLVCVPIMYLSSRGCVIFLTHKEIMSGMYLRTLCLRHSSQQEPAWCGEVIY